MTSQFFEVVGSSQPIKKPKKQQHESVDAYVKLQGQFLNLSYGYYVNTFAAKINLEACQKLPIIEVLSIDKILKQIVKKFMLTDLQLVIVHHIASELQWNFQDSFLRKNLPRSLKQHQDMHPSSALLNFFLNLIAQFVKNYMGKAQQTRAVKNFINLQTKGTWQSIYQQWLKSVPSRIFSLSPRTINTIYSDFTRGCQKEHFRKDYNKMVDSILQLSTTYAMIPGSPSKKRKKNRGSGLEQVSFKPHKVKNIVNPESSISFQNVAPASNIFNSRISNNQFVDSIFSKPKEKIVLKQFRLNSKDQHRSISNHINDFFTKQPQQVGSYNPQSTIGFRLDSIPSFLDYNNRSSLIEPIPYNLRSNSNISKLL